MSTRQNRAPQAGLLTAVEGVHRVQGRAAAAAAAQARAWSLAAACVAGIPTPD